MQTMGVIPLVKVLTSDTSDYLGVGRLATLTTIPILTRPRHPPKYGCINKIDNNGGRCHGVPDLGIREELPESESSVTIMQWV